MIFETFLKSIQELNGLQTIIYLLVVVIASRMGYNELIKKWFNIKSKSPFASRHIILISNIDKLLTEKLNIMNIRILKDQMREVENAVESTIREMKDSFFQELMKRGFSAAQILEGIDYKHYDACVAILYSRVKEDIRHMMRENGLNLKSEIDMRLYIQNRFEKIKDTSTKTFDVYYGGSLIIPRTDLKELHESAISKYRQKFEDTLRTCREIEIQYHRRVSEIEIEIEQLKSNPCGG